MIKLISDKFACFLCKDEGQKNNFDLYEYAVYIILSSAFHIITVIALGLCFNLLVESLVFYFSFLWLFVSLQAVTMLKHQQDVILFLL